VCTNAESKASRRVPSRDGLGPQDTEAEIERASLLHAASNGCRASFSRLYAGTHQRMFTIALKIIKDKEDAKDILQDVYIKVWNQ